MTSLIISTVAYFAASFLISRWLDGMAIPRSMTRSLLVFCAALIVSYGVAVGVDWLADDGPATGGASPQMSTFPGTEGS